MTENLTASTEMRDHLDRTSLGFHNGRLLPGRCRAYNVLAIQADYHGLTFEQLLKMNRREIERFRNCGPKTAKLICEALGIGMLRKPDAPPAPMSAWPDGYGYGRV